MVSFDYYDPSTIFEDNGSGRPMTGGANFELAESFVDSRSPESRWDRNAGAVALYDEDGKIIYRQSGISHGNKYFKYYTKSSGYKATSYGHTERKLMRDALDYLLADQSELPGPSSLFKSSTGLEQEYKILKYLTENTAEYRRHLEEKKIIVKIWSERPACTTETNEDVGGANCTDFVKNICPEGSQFGYIVKDYTRSDNQNGAPKVRAAFGVLESAYKEFKQSRTRCSKQCRPMRRTSWAGHRCN
ncbi:unnamed protein product [Trichogramma brassicae]|uniref:Uncharacterized protein n=1 Tax=Trichogramma brassicae TaxID=86971 RepID=A0A6H5HZJ3_9HYME|nr:unnamed protein product [Trichogramma brassicae]